MALVDVVVVTYNSVDHIGATLELLADRDDVRLVVVDNASTDATVETARALADVVPLPDNRGFAHGCNVGWRRGESPFVLLLNPDAMLDSDSLDALVGTLQRDERAGAVAPRIVAPDGTLDWSQRRFPRLRSTYAQALFLHRVFRHRAWVDEVVRDADAYRLPGSPDWVSGACILVRRTVLERVGGLDEGFFLYCEDIDLCRRIRDAGYRITFDPSASVVHEGGQSAPRATLLPVLAASRVRYARKHQSAAAVALERVGIALGSLTHAIVTRGGSATRQGHLRAIVRAFSA